jgi:A/G-specific adenine glycosylase
MKFAPILNDWYSLNKRELPWRKNVDPYRILLSEIILQQTKVEQGLPYFNQFAAKYPTVFDLANAPEEEVLKLWQGLGYYSRAKNLHHSAKTVAFNLNGVFPNTFVELKKLKGVGDYTAAAIASICFNEIVPVVDGNVYRFLSRLFGISTPIDTTKAKKQFFSLAKSLMETEDPGSFNQAMMEFGALICTPLKPQCSSCVFANQCKALKSNEVHKLPVKIKKSAVKPMHLNYAFIKTKAGFYFQKRPSTGIWANMYELPVLTTETLASANELEDFFSTLKLNIQKRTSFSKPVKHLLTHKKIEAIFHTFELDKYQPNDSMVCVSEPEDLLKYSMPKLIETFVEKSI